MFIVVSVFVPLVLYFGLPWLLQISGLSTGDKHRSLLLVACLLFAGSWYLPSPLIDGQDTSFTTHFVGGGLFCGWLWLYLKRSLDWKHTWWIELFGLFALTSALGTINELFELLLVESGIVNITLSDTPWDLLANTLGAGVFWLSYKTTDFVRSISTT